MQAPVPTPEALARACPCSNTLLLAPAPARVLLVSKKSPSRSREQVLVFVLVLVLVLEPLRARRRVGLPLRGEETRGGAVVARLSRPLSDSHCDGNYRCDESVRGSTQRQRDGDSQRGKVGQGAPHARHAERLQRIARDISVREQRPDHLTQRVLDFERESLADRRRQPRGGDGSRRQPREDGERPA